MYEALLHATAGQEVPITFASLTLLPLGWLALLFSIGILLETLLEIPTGVLADSLGRKFAAITCLVFRAFYFVALLMMWWSGEDDNPHLVIGWRLAAEVLFAISFTFFSGSFLAWVKDSLDAAGAGYRLTEYLARSKVWQWAFTLVGGAAGLYLWLEDLVPWAYGLGFVISGISALVLYHIMDENRQFDFMKLTDLFTASSKEAWQEVYRTWVVGGRSLIRAPQLLSVFATAAAATSLVYLVDYMWPLFTRSYFAAELGQDFSKEWIILLFVVVLAAIGGSYAFSKWLRFYEKKKGALKTESLALICATTYLLHALPILVVVAVSTANASRLTLPLFMLIILIHKIAEGAMWAPSGSLRNYLIPENTKERSTILSLGAMLKNLAIVFLVFFGVGKQADSLTSWLYPAGAVVITVPVMLLLIFLYKPAKL